MPGGAGHSRIRSVGYHVPENRIASERIETAFELEARFGMPVGTIERVTGIKERRMSCAATKASDLAYEAALDAMARGLVRSDDLDVIVYAAVCRDYMEPATAHLIQAQLAARRAFVLDVSNACLSIVDGIVLVDALIAAGHVRTGLVCGGELAGDALRGMWDEMRRLKTPEELFSVFAMFTLGEAGAAVILEPRDAPLPPGHEPLAPGAPAPGFVAFEMASRGEHWDLCTLKMDGSPMTTDSRRLLAAGIGLAGERFDALLERSGWRREDVDLVIPHQVSLAAHRKLMETLRLPLERAHSVVGEFGNTASTTVPVTLAHAAQSGRLKPGMKVVIAGIGSGVSVGLCSLIW